MQVDYNFENKLRFASENGANATTQTAFGGPAVTEVYNDYNWGLSKKFLSMDEKYSYLTIREKEIRQAKEEAYRLEAEKHRMSVIDYANKILETYK